MRYEFGGLIFGGAYTWRGFFSEFYGISSRYIWALMKFSQIALNREKVGLSPSITERPYVIIDRKT